MGLKNIKISTVVEMWLPVRRAILKNIEISTVVESKRSASSLYLKI